MQTFHGTYNHDKKDTSVGFAFVRAWHVPAGLKTNLRGYAKRKKYVTNLECN